jgi:hypothetical protein
MSSSAQKNFDNLFVRYGTTEATSAKYGEYSTLGPERIYETKIDFSDFAAFGTNTILANETSLPLGSHIERVIVEVETAFAGATATLSLGLIQEDRSTTTGLGTTVLANAITVATLVNGAIIELKVGASFVGSLVGSGGNLTVNGLFTALVGTANFTAGSAKVRIFYTTP